MSDEVFFRRRAVYDCAMTTSSGHARSNSAQPLDAAVAESSVTASSWPRPGVRKDVGFGLFIIPDALYFVKFRRSWAAARGRLFTGSAPAHGFHPAGL